MRRWTEGEVRALLSEERLAGLSDALSPREGEALLLALRGRTNAQIARELGIGLDTAKEHLGRAYRKLGVSGRVALAARLLNLGGNPASPNP